MRFVIVTGMSGAGKRTALKVLEDKGYFSASACGEIRGALRDAGGRTRAGGARDRQPHGA